VALLERWLAPSLRTACAIIGDEADARDATQDAFLQAWRELRRLRDLDRFDAWFSRILVNRCRTVRGHRRRTAAREIHLGDLPEAAGAAGDGVVFASDGGVLRLVGDDWTRIWPETSPAGPGWVLALAAVSAEDVLAGSYSDGSPAGSGGFVPGPGSAMRPQGHRSRGFDRSHSGRTGHCGPGEMAGSRLSVTGHG
jgi:DNA-directed RNA polymerase specialized sigma24 family protein